MFINFRNYTVSQLHSHKFAILRRCLMPSRFKLRINFQINTFSAHTENLFIVEAGWTTFFLKVLRVRHIVWKLKSVKPYLLLAREIDEFLNLFIEFLDGRRRSAFRSPTLRTTRRFRLLFAYFIENEMRVERTVSLCISLIHWHTLFSNGKPMHALLSAIGNVWVR